MLETRSDALDNSMAAFDYLRRGGCWLGHGGRVSLLPLVVEAVETHQKVILEKDWYLGMKKAAAGTACIKPPFESQEIELKDL